MAVDEAEVQRQMRAAKALNPSWEGEIPVEDAEDSLIRYFTLEGAYNLLEVRTEPMAKAKKAAAKESSKESA